MTLGPRLLSASLLALFAASLQAAEGIWQELASQAQLAEPHSRLYRADDAALRGRLALAPHEALLDDSVALELPMPDGTRQQFVVVESPIMVPELAAKFPRVKAYKLKGIDDPFASGRADVTALGFRAMLQTSRGVVLIDPAAGQAGVYRSLNRRGQAAPGFSCGVHDTGTDPFAGAALPASPANRIPGSYLTYRIAVAATSEYVAAVPDALSEITTAINRVNQIYERDLGIRLLLVANDGLLLESADEECFSNGNNSAMVVENQVWIDERIGKAAYDIGHVFSTGSGGLAAVGSTCSADFKAHAVTGLPNPTGDTFYIDYVAHEIGHQLSARHTFNGSTLNCSGNRTASSAWEPGSGSTIMAYAGICDAENLQSGSDATFHGGSIAAVDLFTFVAGTCSATLVNGNNDPDATLLSDSTIPANTPFRLDVVASDMDPMTTLSYQWDQLDTGDMTNSATFGTDLGNNPVFRSYSPRADSWRDFPALGTQVKGQTDKAEVLPTTGRTLDFRVTVRDGDSGQDTQDIRLTVVDTGTPFSVLTPNGGTLDTTGVDYTITWRTANTQPFPILCSNVNIDLIAFDGASYTNHAIHSIAANVPNTGSFTDTMALPLSHPRARIRVMCVNNVFYDISDADVTVIGTGPGNYSDNLFKTFFNTGPTVSRPATTTALPALASAGAGLVDVFAGAQLPLDGQTEACEFVPPVRDATALDPRLGGLLLLLALVRLGRRYGRH